VEREHPLHSDSIRNFANGKRSTITTIGSANNDALKDLNPFFVAFDNFGMDTNGIAGFETGNVAPTLAFFNTVDNVAHVFLPP
jgi:hypothetical protein